MEYVRNIAYIYAYQNGFKNKNTGFARIEVWGETLKIFVNMKCAYVQENGYWDVMLFYRQGMEIHGVKIGEIFLHGGVGEYHYVGFAGNLAGSGHEFHEMAGMYFCSAAEKNRVFASEWDDRGFEPAKIVTAAEKNQEDSAAEQKIDDSQRTISQRAENYPAAQISDSYPPVQENDDNIAAFRSDESMGVREPDSFAAAQMAQQETAAGMTAAEVMTAPPVYEAAKEAVPVKISLAQQFADRKKIILFSDDDLYDCMEISLEDIGKLPEDNWCLKNNSFLNHAYFNFHHLILAKQRGHDKEYHYIIGVPGLFTNRERNTAAMFGFEHFKFSMRSDVHLNQFGYWYRTIAD